MLVRSVWFYVVLFVSTILIGSLAILTATVTRRSDWHTFVHGCGETSTFGLQV